MYDVAEALNYLHSCNVVHGGIAGVCTWTLTENLADFTQMNTLVNEFGRARVAEFALATVHPNNGSTDSITELRNHTTRWSAPEVLGETGPLTKKADVFSFAMVTIEVSLVHVSQQSLTNWAVFR